MLKQRVIYMGLFVTELPADIREIALRNGATESDIIKHPHITYRYRPSDKEIDGFILNNLNHQTIILVCGFGILYRDSDGNLNEEGNGEIVNIAIHTTHMQIHNGKFSERENEHITLATLNNGKAVDSGLIQNWKPIPEGCTIILNGRYGFFVGGDRPVKFDI